MKSLSVTSVGRVLDWRCQSLMDTETQKDLAVACTLLTGLCTSVHWINSSVVSSDLHSKQRPLAAGFKADYPTERTEHITIAWSDCTVTPSSS